ncbi:MAG TPA: hypothetical protein VFO85_15830, partial [Vicinamibacteria bacterium]|nr:hypothetical protein [Vicinamibacteria bacterium]
LDGRALEFVARAGVHPLELSDLETGSDWDFSGQALRGPLAGRALRKVWYSKQYWFDWKLQRPHTTLFARPPLSRAL